MGRKGLGLAEIDFSLSQQTIAPDAWHLKYGFRRGREFASQCVLGTTVDNALRISGLTYTQRFRLYQYGIVVSLA